VGPSAPFFLRSPSGRACLKSARDSGEILLPVPLHPQRYAAGRPIGVPVEVIELMRVLGASPAVRSAGVGAEADARALAGPEQHRCESSSSVYPRLSFRRIGVHGSVCPVHSLEILRLVFGGSGRSSIHGKPGLAGGVGAMERSHIRTLVFEYLAVRTPTDEAESSPRVPASVGGSDASVLAVLLLVP
jgi:hypothetical protein